MDDTEEPEEVEKEGEGESAFIDIRQSHDELQHSSTSLPISEESSVEHHSSDSHQNLPTNIENVNFSIKNCEIDDDEKTKKNCSGIIEI